MIGNSRLGYEKVDIEDLEMRLHTKHVLVRFLKISAALDITQSSGMYAYVWVKSECEVVKFESGRGFTSGINKRQAC